MAVIAIVAGLAVAPEADAADLQLSLPVDCAYGVTCFIQQFVDIDPGPGARDHRCAHATYDGHKGTDFRVRIVDARKGVPVRAAASGTVKAMRNSVPDRIVRSQADRRKLKGRECGNGVVLAHDDGWQTQYCHMREGSVLVAPGQHVARGQTLGLVGYSGDAGFAHLHLNVRRNGRIVDPFTGREPDGTCANSTGSGLWDPAAAALLSHPGDRIAGLGFAPYPLSEKTLEIVPTATPEAAAAWPSLVGWMWVINTRAGDRLALAFSGPTRALRVRREIRLDRDNAQYVLSLGKKRPPGGWPSGRYRVTASIIRNGHRVHRRETMIVIN